MAFGMPVYTSEALILRTYKLGEADRIVVFLTRDRGKKRGVANGARRVRSRFIGALEPMTRAGVAYYEREQRDLVRINYVEPHEVAAVAVERGGPGARRVLRGADRRVGARRACRRAAVPAGVGGDRRHRGRRGDRAAGALLRVLAPAAPGRVSVADVVPRVRRAARRGGAVMPPRDDLFVCRELRPGGRHRPQRGRAAIPARRGRDRARSARGRWRCTRARPGSSKPCTGAC